MENDFLPYNGKFEIYQIRGDIDEVRNFRFTSMRELTALGLSINPANYKHVYTGKPEIRDTLTNLNKIFKDFNENWPTDFFGRSISVSDVIVLQWRDKTSAHFVDSTGFIKLPSFINNETN
jgi:hypothetical protein